MARRAVYGLDIETDTTENGLDPDIASIVTVALSSPGCDEVFSGRETTLLCDLDARLRSSRRKRLIHAVVGLFVTGE